MRSETETTTTSRPAPRGPWKEWQSASACAAELAAMIERLGAEAGPETVEIQPAVAEAELAALVARWGRPLPAELRALYRRCGGLRLCTADGVMVELLPVSDEFPGVVDMALTTWPEPPWELDWRHEVLRRSEVEASNQALPCVGWYRAGETICTYLCVNASGVLCGVTFDREDVLQFRADLLRLVEGAPPSRDPLEPLVALVAGWVKADG